MYYILIAFAILNIIIGFINFRLKKIKLGIFQMLLSILTPIYVYFFCKLKERFVFGGSDFDFLIQTALIDGLIEPWIVLLIYIFLVYLIIISVINILKMNKYY